MEKLTYVLAPLLIFSLNSRSECRLVVDCCDNVSRSLVTSFSRRRLLLLLLSLLLLTVVCPVAVFRDEELVVVPPIGPVAVLREEELVAPDRLCVRDVCDLASMLRRLWLLNRSSSRLFSILKYSQ